VGSFKPREMSHVPRFWLIRPPRAPAAARMGSSGHAMTALRAVLLGLMLAMQVLLPSGAAGAATPPPGVAICTHNFLAVMSGVRGVASGIGVAEFQGSWIHQEPEQAVSPCVEARAASKTPCSPRKATEGVAFGRYSDVKGHHLNQDAAFKSSIPTKDGVATPLSGNAFTEPGTPHFEAHASLEVSWDQFRRGGARAGELPTNLEYSQAPLRSLRAAGKAEAEAWVLVKAAAGDRVQHGLLGGMPVPRVPGRINQSRP